MISLYSYIWQRQNTHLALYFTFDVILKMVHKRLEDPTIDKWKCRAHILTSVSPLYLPASPSVLLYLAPPRKCMATFPMWASQLTLVTDRRPSGSSPSLATEVTSTLNIAMLNDPLSCLKTHSTNKQVSARWCWWRFHATYPSRATAALCHVCVCVTIYVL